CRFCLAALQFPFRLCPCRSFPYPATPETYTLSLHDALPISAGTCSSASGVCSTSTRAWAMGRSSVTPPRCTAARRCRPASGGTRSEEHTSELQSRSDIVCRLLLEKKKPFTQLTSAHKPPANY